MPTPEAKARKTIDDLLEAAGRHVKSREHLNLGAARAVAVREFPPKTGFADYLLFVGRRPIGVVEAKSAGTPLSGVEPQTDMYSAGLLLVKSEKQMPCWRIGSAVCRDGREQISISTHSETQIPPQRSLTYEQTIIGR